MYWNGIVRARDTFGKFTFVPVDPPVQTSHGRGPKQFTEVWRARTAAGPLTFELRWIPFLNERETPLGDLDHRVAGRAPGARWHRRVPAGADRDQGIEAHRASCLGARRQSWQLAGNDRRSAEKLPSTRFTAARALAYRLSQQHRQALPEESYRSFFENGEVSAALAATLIARYKEKQAAGQWVPDLGQL